MCGTGRRRPPPPASLILRLAERRQRQRAPLVDVSRLAVPAALIRPHLDVLNDHTVAGLYLDPESMWPLTRRRRILKAQDLGGRNPIEATAADDRTELDQLEDLGVGILDSKDDVVGGVLP